jgi:hypothetical protein
MAFQELKTDVTDPKVIGNYIEVAFWIIVSALLFAWGRRA